MVFALVACLGQLLGHAPLLGSWSRALGRVNGGRSKDQSKSRWMSSPRWTWERGPPGTSEGIWDPSWNFCVKDVWPKVYPLAFSPWLWIAPGSLTPSQFWALLVLVTCGRHCKGKENLSWHRTVHLCSHGWNQRWTKGVWCREPEVSVVVLLLYFQSSNKSHDPPKWTTSRKKTFCVLKTLKCDVQMA